MWSVRCARAERCTLTFSIGAFISSSHRVLLHKHCGRPSDAVGTIPLLLFWENSLLSQRGMLPQAPKLCNCKTQMAIIVISIVRVLEFPDCSSWRKRTVFSTQTLNISYVSIFLPYHSKDWWVMHQGKTLDYIHCFHEPPEDNNSPTEETVQRKRGSFAIQTVEHQVCKENVVSSCTFDRELKTWQAFPAAIHLQPQYFSPWNIYSKLC